MAAPLLLLAGLPAARGEDVKLPSPSEIDKAIERGVGFVLEEQKPTGTWGSGKHAVGKTALAVYTLLHGGVAEGQGTKESKRLARALKFLDKNGAGRSTRRVTDTRTYEASLLLMLLRARGRPEDRGRMQNLTTLLCKTQSRNGQWWYDAKGSPDKGDNSNTQFATLALGQAYGEGLKLQAQTAAQALRWWMSAQGTKGGFGYASGGSPKSAATGSMTAAGIACIAIWRALGPHERPQDVNQYSDGSKEAAAQKKAVQFLADVFSVTKNHGPSVDRKNQKQRKTGRGWMHYYLWTLERAMVLSGQEKLGTRDWYAEGARRLLDTQKKDGSWRQEMPLYATCFALLFLTRAADPPRAFTPSAQPTVPGAGGAPITPAPNAEPPANPDPSSKQDPAKKGPRPLPPGTVLDWLQEALAVGELPRRCRQAGAGSLLPLVHGMRHPDAKVRQRAFEALRGLLPNERTDRTDRHPLRRGRLALWLRLYARHLVLVEGRFHMPKDTKR